MLDKVLCHCDAHELLTCIHYKTDLSVMKRIKNIYCKKQTTFIMVATHFAIADL